MMDIEDGLIALAFFGAALMLGVLASLCNMGDDE